MVTVSEFDSMNAADRQTTIQNLMQGNQDDVTNAQILMIREQELAGQNTSRPTVANPTQAAQIRETQAVNAQVYQAQQAQQQSTPPAQTPSNTFWTSPAITPDSLPTRENLLKRGAVEIAAPAGYKVVDKSITPTATGIEYKIEPTPNKAPIIEPTLGNIITNPVGVLGTFLTFADLAASKSDNPIAKFVSFQAGGLGQIVNVYTNTKNTISAFGKAESNLFTPQPVLGIKNAIGDARGNIPVIREVSPFQPVTDEAKIGMKINEIGSSIAVIAVTPVIGPAFGVRASTVVFGQIISPLVSQGFKSAQGGDLLTVEEALGSAAEGGVFSLVGAGAIQAAGKVAPKILVQLQGPASAGAKATGFAGRTAINVGVDAAQGYVYSGGDPAEAVRGAAFGAIFSVGFDTVGYAASKMPKIKYGNVNVELDEGSANWQGLYVERGANAKLLTGNIDLPAGKKIKSHGVSGEDAGYVPKSAVDSEVTLKVMEKAGYDIEVIRDIKDMRGLMGETQNVRSKYIQEMLPTETQTLSSKGVSVVKDFAISNADNVDRIYGSFTQRAQISEGFEYAVKTGDGSVSALRVPADIDIKLTVGGDKATGFTSKLAGQLLAAGEDVRVSPEKPTLIEARSTSGAWRHAVDIHAVGDTVEAVPAKAWGYDITKRNIAIEKIPVQQLSEQGLAKGVSVLGFKQDSTIGPVAHRAKDVPDFFQAQRSLLESKGYNVDADARFTRLTERFGVKDVLTESFDVPAEYIVSRRASRASGSSPSAAALSPVVNAALKDFNYPSTYPAEQVKVQRSLAVSSPASKSANDYSPSAYFGMSSMDVGVSPFVGSPSFDIMSKNISPVSPEYPSGG
ncbi:MAG TPA: hypothetical protein VLH35_05290, partial [Candidatus Acidoferrales bacterium]|nr:hypothetical protein [Candidatus Acidoferrales bacterium]